MQLASNIKKGRTLVSDIHVYDPEDDEWAYTGYGDYYISNTGRVWGPGRHGKPRLIKPTPNSRTGHLEVALYVNGIRLRKYVHRLVAEAFIPNPHSYPLVRHLNDDPSDNCVENLAWGTQTDNIHDAIQNGNFKYFTDKNRELAMQKRRTPIRAINLITGEENVFESQQEASRKLNINQSSIHRVLSKKGNSAGGHFFVYANNDNPIDISSKKFSRHSARIKAINVLTNEEFIFNSQTEAARMLEMSIASVSNILSGKYKQLRGYRFKYVDEEDRND